MERFLGKYSPYLYVIMRIMVGFLYACHGAQKLFGVLGGFGPSGGTAPFFSIYGPAGLIEFFGGVCIATGFLTGYAAFIASGEMASAYFINAFPRGFWPILNGGERAVLYCFTFLYVASKGAGPWSLDSARGVSRWA